jgi:ATP-binding cassette subfamily C protein LapB
MYYSDSQQLKEEFDWLSKVCTLDHFVASRLSPYEHEKLYKKITPQVNNLFVKNFVNEFLSKLDLQDTVWESAVNSTMLRIMIPVIALIPSAGMRIIIDREADGSYKTLGVNGVENYKTFPKKTLFRMLKFKIKKASVSTAKAMFTTIALEQKKYLFYAIVASVSINLLALAASFYTMQVYDRVIPTNGMSTLIVLTAGVGIAIFLEMILKLSRASIIDQASKNMDVEYSHNIFQRFLNVRSDSLPKSIGTLSSKINSYVSVRGFITTAAIFVLIDFPFAFFFLGIITLIGGAAVGKLILTFIFASIVVGYIFKGRIERLTKSSSMAYHKKHGLLVESVENAQKIKTTGASWGVLNKWGQHTEDAINDDIRIKHSTDISSFIATFIQQISYVATVAFGAYLIGTTSELTMGSLIAITIISNKVFGPIAQIPGIFVQWGKAKIAIEDLDGLYELARDNEGVERPITSSLQSHNIKCSNLKFAYNQDSVVLNIPYLEIAEGEKIAILGVIGAGKSTLLKLLAGLYKPSEGKVLLDGIDLQQLSRNNTCSSIGYLEQDTKLFAGTLRDNLTVGLIGISDEEVLIIAKLTGLISLISALPKGLDTEVPEGGDSVSGGQRQLIALTRMLIGNSNILLLDEPTASMDERTEKHILNTINQTLLPNQTLIVVTHKPSLLTLVDRIIILNDQGGIVANDKKEVVLQMLENNKSKQQKKLKDA